jgi:glucose/arabinose dehydrogenase
VPTPDLEGFRGRLVQVAKLDQPLALAVRTDDTALYIAEKTGRVVAIRDGKLDQNPVVDLSHEVSQGGEQGLLGLAFSPDGRFIYVNYTDLSGDTHVTEFEMLDGTADVASRREVLSVDQPYSNHNGGNLVFGPDGYLYIGLGDGGSAGDPQDHAQDLGTLLGKMLRIDPRPTGGMPYRIPPDNPFAGREGARAEIWDFGLRNPWRYSFDRVTGELWIGDVGQDRREEIDLEPPGEGGRNYGWDGYEGNLVYEQPLPKDAVRPVHSYGGELGSSVIGGYVYGGSQLPALQGAYVFGDFFNPVLRALVPSANGGFEEMPVGLKVDNLSSFGEDAAGELYALSLSGPVYRLAP